MQKMYKNIFFWYFKTKDCKIKGNCNLLTKAQFHELDWSSLSTTKMVCVCKECKYTLFYKHNVYNEYISWDSFKFKHKLRISLNWKIKKNPPPLTELSNGFRGVRKGRTHPLNFEQQNFLFGNFY